jgi:hypothetical protein
VRPWHNKSMHTDDLPHEAREAIEKLIPRIRRTGDAQRDLIAAAAEVRERRRTNTELGGTVLGVLLETFKLSWRQIDAVTGIPWATARGWHRRPPGDRRPA